MLSTLLLLVTEHLRHRPIRSLLTVVGVAIGVSAWLAIRVVNGEVYRSFEQSVESVVGEASVMVSGGSEGMDEQNLRPLQSHPGVRSVSPVLKIEGEIQAGAWSGRPLRIWGVDLLEQGKNWEVRGPSGIFSREDWDQLFAPTTVFLEEELAEKLGMGQGGILSVKVKGSVHHLIVGRVVDSFGLLGGVQEQVVMDIAATQWMFGWLGRIHHAAIVPEPGVAISTLIQELRSLLLETIQVSRSSRRNRQVESMLHAFQMNLTMLSGISLLVGIFLVYNATAFSVVHHRQEIGILRSIGMKRQSITMLFLLEAGVLGVAGGVSGCWLGLLLARWLTVLIGQNVGELYGMDSLFSMPVPVHMLIEAMSLGVGVSLVGALRPAWEASTMAPVQALAGGQSQTEDDYPAQGSKWVVVGSLLGAGMLSQMPPVQSIPVGGYTAAFCLLMGGAAAGPVLSLWFSRWSQRRLGTRAGLLPALAAEQMGRNPRRTSVTMAAIVVGLAILVGVGIMIQSFRQTVELWIEQTLMADIIIAPTSWLGEQDSLDQNQGLPRRLAKHILDIPGIEAVDSYVETSVEADGKTVALVSRDVRLHSERSQYLFLQGESSEVLRHVVDDRGVIISEVLAKRLGVSVGNLLPLTTPRGTEQFPVKGVFYDYATDGGKVVMDQGLFAEKWEERDVTVFAVYLKEGQSLSAVRREIEDTLKNETPIATISNGELKEEILDIFDRTFRVTYVLELIALSVAVLGIMNTLLTSILERRRELATLRAIGASGGQIQGLIVWESCYLAGLGAVVGIVVGMALSVVLIKVINKQSFGWTIQFALAWETIGMAVLVALAAALIGAWVPARWASRQTIAENLRYE
ncbi:MAG: FtsX-like permease family protein [Nitrospirales bacterium]